MFSHRLDISHRFQKSNRKMANLSFMRKANIFESMIHGKRATVFENRPLGREILTKLWRKIYQRFRSRPVLVVSYSTRLPFKLGDPGSILGRTSTQGLKIIEENYLYNDISKWLDFHIISDRKLNRSYLGFPVNWEIHLPMSDKLKRLDNCIF